MAQIDLQLDKDRFLNDILNMANFIVSDVRGYSRYHFSEFLSMNQISDELYGICIDDEDILNLKPHLVNKLRRSQDEEYDKFCYFVGQNTDFLYELFKNTVEYFNKINFVPFNFNDCIRRFSQEDGKGIILDFYSQYSDKYYNIVKRYFDENRIESGYELGPFLAAMFVGAVPIKSGYIFTNEKVINSKFLSTIVHEFGHVIDAETFTFPQQKTLGIWEDTLLEIPSTCFENIFVQQLTDKRIDYTGGLLLNNAIYLDLKESSEVLLETLKNESYCIDDEGDSLITTKDENDQEVEMFLPFREPLIYSLGNLFSLYFKELEKKDKVAFLKAFNNIITSRKEDSLENLICRLGVTPQDFATLKYVKSDIEENTMKLKKRFNYHS
ncbi:MAG: hypothetical protein ACI33S_05245 [Bacilli bacterium]